jgi:hypothetical protein
VWVIDPGERVAYSGTGSGLKQAQNGELAVPDTRVLISIADLFDRLDRIREFSRAR